MGIIYQDHRVPGDDVQQVDGSLVIVQQSNLAFADYATVLVLRVL